MWENYKSGSVRGELSFSYGTNIVTLPLRKQEANREYKAVPKVERYSSTRQTNVYSSMVIPNASSRSASVIPSISAAAAKSGGP